MSFNLYNVDGGSLKSLEYFESLESNKVYLIIDKSKGIPKIWIWVGDNANVNDRYHAGMLATRAKAQLQIYNADVEIVDEGSVPNYFPNFASLEIEYPQIKLISANSSFQFIFFFFLVWLIYSSPCYERM